MKNTTHPARLEQITKLEREFRAFSKIFAEILKVKEESALVAQNRLARSGTSLRYKLDDLPQQCRRFRTAGDPVRRQESDRAIPGGAGARQ